jgi:hypothetical protein
LSVGFALAFDSATILDAKLHAGHGGYPCVVRGSVTAQLSPAEYYIQDATGGVRVSSPAFELHEGDRLEVEGWMYLADSAEFQIHSYKVWYLGNGPPVSPRLVALADAYSGVWQGQVVAVRGAVLNVDFGAQFDSASIQNERTSIRVFYPANRGRASLFERIYPGMQVAVTGISVPQTADPEFDGYQVRLRSSTDLVVRPMQGGEESPRRELAGGTAALLCIGAAAWVWTSRQQRIRRASQVQ